jgi:hypothetical protein
VRDALKRLRASRTRIIGALLTKLDARHAAYGYGYAYEYDYAYGGRKARRAG